MTRNRFIVWFWTVLILVACWTPGRNLPVEELPHGLLNVPHLDKVVHMGMFFGFGVLWMAATAPRRRAWARVLGAGVLLGIVTELGQAVPLVARDPDVLDALSDAMGVALGVGAWCLLARRWGDTEPSMANDQRPMADAQSGH